MDAKMFRGRGKPYLSRGERISASSENQEWEEGRKQRCRALFLVFLMAVTLHLKNAKRKSSVWKVVSVRKFFHINLHLLWFSNMTFWCSETPFYIVNHTAIT